MYSIYNVYCVTIVFFNILLPLSEPLNMFRKFCCMLIARLNFVNIVHIFFLNVYNSISHVIKN